MAVLLLPHRRVLGAALALALVASTCSGDELADGVSGDATAVLAASTRVVEDAEAVDLEVLADSVLIPGGHELEDVAVGDVIAVGPTEQIPNGLLRLVTSVDDDGGQVVATTRQARLEEAFDELDVSVSAPVRFERVVPADAGDALGSRLVAPVAAAGAPVVTTALPGPGAQKSSDDVIAAVDVEENDAGFVASFDELLHDGDDDESTTDDQITLSGSVAVDVDLNIELDVGIDPIDLDLDGNPLGVAEPELQAAKFETVGSMSTNLELDARQAADFGKDRTLFAIEGTPFFIPVGPVVVPVRLRMPIVVGWDGRLSVAADTSVTTSTEVRMGVEFDGDKWDPIGKVDSEHDFNPPEADDSDPGLVSVWAGPRLEIRIWEELASGSIGIDGVVELELLGASPWFCLSAGYRVPVGFEFVGKSVFNDVVDEDLRLLLPDACEAGVATSEEVVRVAGYSRVFGTCTPLGTPISESGLRVADAGSGGVIVAAGMTRKDARDVSDDRFQELWLLRLDSSGNILWTRTYRELVGDVVGLATTDQGFAVALSTGRMLFLDRRGQILDARRLSGLDFRLHALESLSGSAGFLALGVDGTTPVVAELGPEGSVGWARRYQGELADGAARAGSRRDDGGWNIAIGGGDFLGVDPNGGLEQAKRLVVDGEASTELRLVKPDIKAAGAAGTLGGLAPAVIADAELDNAIAADLGLAGLTSPRLGTPAGEFSLNGLPDGDFGVAGPLSAGGLAVGRAAGTGAQRWAVGYESGDESPIGFPGVAATSDGGIVAVGWTWALATARCSNETGQEESDLWVVKLPTTGLITPAGDSGLERVTGGREVANSSRYELVPIEANDEPFPLEAVDDLPVPVHTNFPFVDSHLPDAAGGTPGRTIPAGQYWPDEPITVMYEYTKGVQPAKVTDRVVVAWEGDRLSATFLDAQFYRQGEPRGAFRYIVGRENEPLGRGCYLAATTCNDRSFAGPGTDNSAFFPGPGGNIPRFGGTLPAIEVDDTETRGGVEVACGNASDELFGELRLCVHEPTGAILYAHTVAQCNDPDGPSDACVELEAVEIRDPIPDDFTLPGQ